MNRLLRRVAFQIDLWIGVGLGLYVVPVSVVPVSVSGALLALRTGRQRASEPRFYRDLLLAFDHTPRNAGDRVMASMVPLHLGVCRDS